MANTKRKLPVWAIILYAVTGLILLAGVAIIIFGVIDSSTLLPYKRQNILEYFSDEMHYYTVAGTVEERSVGTLSDGAYPLTLMLEDVTSDEEGIQESGRVTFTIPAETYSSLAERGFFDALQAGTSVESTWRGTCGGISRSRRSPRSPSTARPIRTALRRWLPFGTGSKPTSTDAAHGRAKKGGAQTA